MRFYIMCRLDGRIEDTEFSEWERGFVSAQYQHGLSLLDCPRCGWASHLVFRQATPSDNRTQSFNLTKIGIENCDGLVMRRGEIAKLYNDFARDAYLGAQIPVWEA